jgi:hypothetical protein
VSLYFLALVSMSSFSKSLRRDLKIFLGGWPVLSAISWRVNSLPSVFRAFMTSWSVLFSLTMALPFPFFVGSVCYGLVGFFNFAVSQCENGLGPMFSSTITARCWKTREKRSKFSKCGLNSKSALRLWLFVAPVKYENMPSDLN